MKLKQIAALRKDSGRIILYGRTDSAGVVSQWIGDGYSCYPLEGLPYMEMEHIINIFELNTAVSPAIITLSRVASLVRGICELMLAN